MCKHCEMPLILPLSNPSSKAEITAEKAYEYAHGKCVYASGGPTARYHANLAIEDRAHESSHSIRVCTSGRAATLESKKF